MNGEPMSWALAGRMAVSTILILIGYALLVLAIGRWMQWLSRKYPRVMTTHKEYYGVDVEAPARELERYDHDWEEPLPPAA